MSFQTISIAQADADLGARTMAAYAKEGSPYPDAAWNANRWAIAADPSVEAPYASAIAAGIERPGWDEGVITDGALTAAVQAHPWEVPT